MCHCQDPAFRWVSDHCYGKIIQEEMKGGECRWSLSAEVAFRFDYDELADKELEFAALASDD